jgi:hypothetical protein
MAQGSEDRTEREIVIEHPNRAKGASRATKASVLLLLIVSAALEAVVAVGGWDVLAGMQVPLIALILLNLVMAFFIARWNSGVLPVAAALATIMLIFAAVSAPAWLDRDKAGFTDPLLSAGLLGLVTFLIVPVQVLLIAFAMRGFAQRWNVEVERLSDGSTRAVPAR